MRPIIEIENISKQYRLGYIGTGSMADDLNRWWSRMRGKEDPFLKIGDVNDRSTVGTSDYVWALRDINITVNQGDVVGIIGKNGAGKSTLLKILSRVTTPTTGSITARGRIASLLEVGTGFHGELTGRENIYLNGSILGMRKQEIKAKLDEIIDFSGCDRYIDTPVKRYSSGMYVRLAFAVAAHLEPEILIVDEVLAVGDAEFQKKAIGKMQDISSGQGRTVLFVSHNMTAVKNLCKTGILLQNGTIQKTGLIDYVVNDYLSDETVKGIVNNYWNDENAPHYGDIKVKSSYIQYEGERLTVNTPFKIITEFWCLKEDFPINVSMHLFDNNGNCIFNIATIQKPLKKGLHKAEFFIPSQFMNDGLYYVNNMYVTGATPYFHHEHAHSFEIHEERETSAWHGKWIGSVRPTFIKNNYSFIEEL